MAKRKGKGTEVLKVRWTAIPCPCVEPSPTQRVHSRDMGLTSAIAKDESMGLSLRLRGGGAPDSKGKGACMQQQRRTPA